MKMDISSLKPDFKGKNMLRQELTTVEVPETEVIAAEVNETIERPLESPETTIPDDENTELRIENESEVSDNAE